MCERERAIMAIDECGLNGVKSRQTGADGSWSPSPPVQSGTELLPCVLMESGPPGNLRGREGS